MGNYRNYWICHYSYSYRVFCIGGAKSECSGGSESSVCILSSSFDIFCAVLQRSSTHAPTTTSFRSSPVKTVTKPSTIRSVKPVTTPAKPMPVSSSSTQKKSRKIGFQYDYYAFTDCIPYSSGSFQGWKCIDRD